MKRTIGRVGMWLVAAGALGGLAAEAPPARVPPGAAVSVAAPVVGVPPFLDGVLDDTCWREAAAITEFHVFNQAGKAEPQKAFLARDDAWLYLAFEIARPHPTTIRRTVFESDDAVVRDDSLDIFIDPGSGGSLYLHYMLNAANIKADQLVVKRGRDRACRMPWRSATRVTKTGWNAEIAIPLRWLTLYQRHAPVDLTNARICLGLKVVTPTLDPYLTVMYETERMLTWPAVSAFHDPAQFAPLNGLPADGGTDVANLFLPSFGAVRLAGYALKDGTPGYALSVEVRGGPGEADVCVKDRPASGDASFSRYSVPLVAGEPKTLSIHVPTAAPGRRSAMVWLGDAARGGAFESRRFDEQAMIVAEPLDVLPDRNYYTTEAAARLVCRVRLAPEARAACRLAVKDSAGQTVAGCDSLSDETVVEVPLAAIPEGRHALAVELQDAGGNRLAAQEAVVVKRPPNPGSEVKIDQLNRVALKDGRPVFPFGLVVIRVDSQSEALFRRLAEAGFNTLLWWCRLPETPVEEVRACLDLAQQHGLMVVDAVNIKPYSPVGGATWAYRQQQAGAKAEQTMSAAEETAGALETLDRLTPRLEPALDVLKAHPAYLGSWNVDEPYDDPCIAVAERYYKWMTARDPYHPLVLLYMRHIPPGRRWTDWAEVLAYDVYIYPGVARIESTPPYMALMTESLRQRADGLHKVSWMVPMTEGLNIARCPRTLRADEQRCQTYMALIHGAKGLLYFCGPATYTKVMWDALSGLAHEMRTLGPAAVAPAVPQTIAYEPGAMDIVKRTFPDVHAALFRHPDGRTILVAANGQRYPVDVRFEVSLLAGGGRVQRLFADAPCAVEAGGFSDRFEAYGTRAYVLEAPQGALPAAGEVSVRVVMTPHPDEAPPDPAFESAEEVVKRRNVVPNPSLEQMSASGLPDYCRPRNTVFQYRALVGEPDAVWGVETNHPFHGRHCVRTARRADAASASAEGSATTAGLCYVPALAKPAPYVFSVYLRAAADGQQAEVSVDGLTPGKQNFTLTTDWQRYVLKGVMASGGAKELAIVPARGATVWLDALQLEAGEDPTPFTEE